MEESLGLDFTDIERKLGRRVPESLLRSVTEGLTAESVAAAQGQQSLCYLRLHSSVLQLRQDMAQLRAIDVRLMHQLLSIHEGIESLRWMMEEKSLLASRDSSLAGSFCSLSESPEASLGDSCDGMDGISVGSYLDGLAEDLSNRISPMEEVDCFLEKQVEEDGLRKASLDRENKADIEEYYCFG